MKQTGCALIALSLAALLSFICFAGIAVINPQSSIVQLIANWSMVEKRHWLPGLFVFGAIVTLLIGSLLVLSSRLSEDNIRDLLDNSQAEWLEHQKERDWERIRMDTKKHPDSQEQPPPAK